MFDNPVLEQLTRSSPALIYGVYIPLILALLVYSELRTYLRLWQILLSFGGGVFFWTFFEYIMHRYVFHFVTDHPRVQRFHYAVHGVHHEYPRDKDRLFLPPLISLLIAVLVFGLFYLLMGSVSFAFFPGFVAGYLLYGTMHFLIHSRKPPFSFMKKHWRNHALHHYKFPDKAFGVSSSFWDHVFGTVPEYDGEVPE